MNPDAAFLRFTRNIDHALGDRRVLKHVRRRIRASSLLTDRERSELLERARYTPGCISPELEIAEDGSLRPVTYDERMADRWLSETEDGGIRSVTPETVAEFAKEAGAVFPQGARAQDR